MCVAIRLFIHVAFCYHLLIEQMKDTCRISRQHAIIHRRRIRYQQHQQREQYIQAIQYTHRGIAGGVLDHIDGRHPSQEPSPYQELIMLRNALHQSSSHSLTPPDENAVRFEALYSSGLSATDLARLPLTIYTKPKTDTEDKIAGEHHDNDNNAAAVNVEKEDSTHSCNICLEQFVVGDNVSFLPCTHCYHHDCISVWLSLRNLCPDCRTTVIPILSANQPNTLSTYSYLSS